MTPKPPSERDREMANEFVITFPPRDGQDPTAMVNSAAQLLAQAREEGRLEGIEQAAELVVRFGEGPSLRASHTRELVPAIRALAKDGGK